MIKTREEMSNIENRKIFKKSTKPIINSSKKSTKLTNFYQLDTKNEEKNQIIEITNERGDKLEEK